MNNCRASLRNTCWLHAEHRPQIYLPWTFAKMTLVTTYYPGIHIGSLDTRSVARREGWAFCGSNNLLLLQTCSIWEEAILLTSYIATLSG